MIEQAPDQASNPAPVAACDVAALRQVSVRLCEARGQVDRVASSDAAVRILLDDASRAIGRAIAAIGAVVNQPDAPR